MVRLSANKILILHASAGLVVIERQLTVMALMIKANSDLNNTVAHHRCFLVSLSFASRCWKICQKFDAFLALRGAWFRS